MAPFVTLAQVRMQKSIIVVIDPDASKGGLTRQQVNEQLHQEESLYTSWGLASDELGPDTLFEGLFAFEPIEWNRLGCFQARSVAIALCCTPLRGQTCTAVFMQC